jgi:cytochrome oxidase Cu insertion factor (SCO1/SenC/PrrC family)
MIDGMNRRLALAGAVVVGAGAGIAIALLTTKPRAVTPPAEAAQTAAAFSTWPSGTRRAPGFLLHDEHGAPVVPRNANRATLITFVDPVCRNLCPIEARTLAAAVRRLGPRSPVVLGVSVNPAADKAANFRADAREWRLPPSWHWAVGPRPALARVWRSYGIAVQEQTRRAAGMTVHEVAHNEETYVVDARGYTRALLVFPFTVSDVVRAVRAAGST